MLLIVLTMIFIIGGVNRDAQIRFGLSPEEVGLMLNQLPENEVNLTRRMNQGYVSGGVVSSEMPDKTLRIIPAAEGGAVQFLIDYEKDGVGSQPPGDGGASGPLEVLAQLGEVEVMREIMRTSIPALTGWSALLEQTIQRSIDDAINEGNGYGGASYGYDSGELPF